MELKEIQKKLEQNKKEQEQIQNEINNLYSKSNKLYDDYEDLKLMFNKEKYKDTTLTVGTYYYEDNLDSYGYHDVKQCILYIDGIEHDLIYVKKFIIRNDDGDETFYIKKQSYNIFDLLTYLDDNKIVEISKDFANSIMSQYLL